MPIERQKITGTTDLEGGRVIGKGTKIYPFAQITGVVGTDCKVSTKAIIKGRVGNGCKIGFNSIIEDDAEVGDYTEVENNVIVHQGVKIGKYCLLERRCEVFRDLGNNVKVGAFSKVW